jgi:hypothetical protein
MQTLKTQLATLLLSTLCLLTGAFAQFSPSQDSYTFSHRGAQNYGTAPTIIVESSSIARPPAISNAYIQFDLSSIPSSYTGANVSKASLKLFVNGMANAGSFNVDMVNGSWTELGISYNNAPALGTTIASSIPLTTANAHDYVIVDVTSAVQAWLDGSQPNDGIALVANSGLGVLFDSKENTATSHPPELDIVFAGGGGAITGITTAPSSGLMGGGSTGNLSLSLINTCSIGQVLAWNGAGGGWVCSTVSGGGGGITGSGTVNSLPLFNGVTSLASSNVFQSSTNTNIGIGTATPQATLDVNGAVNAATSLNLGGNPFAFGSYPNQNAFVGFAGNSTMTGLYNTASGFQALLSNTTGTGNAASGTLALTHNTTGSQNTAVGGAALANNTLGFYNTASGNQALLSNTIGGDNTASGFQALDFNTTGGGNTALGYEAGDPTNSVPTSGSNNTFVGYIANPGTQTTLNNATAIGANAQVTASNALVLGSIFGTNGCNTPCGSVSVGIGTTAPAYPLDVNGVIRSSTGGFMFPDGTVQITKATGGGSGTVTSVAVITGGGLAASPNPITGSGALTIDTSVVPLLATSNTFGGAITAPSFNGSGAGLTNVNAAALGGFPSSTFATLGANAFNGNQTIAGMVGIGTTTPQATLDVNGTVNATTGFNIGEYPFAFGSLLHSNAFLGFAGNSNPSNTGTGNTANGTQAFYSNTTGGGNSAFGVRALLYNTTGNGNTAIGSGALADNTGDTTGNGSNNTAVGIGSLGYNSIGNDNTALGDTSGLPQNFGAITGSINTFLGAHTTVDTGTRNNTTAIGAYAEVAESNALVLGSILNTNNCTAANSCASTNVGIGTTTPQATLDVEAPNGTPFPTVIFGSGSNPAQFTVNSLTTNITGQASISETSGSSNIAINSAGLQLTGVEILLKGATTIQGAGPTNVIGDLAVTGMVTCGSGCGGGGGGSGTVTSVATGLGLTGGPITTSGTLSINTAVVPQLGVANTFTGANKFTGSTTAAAITATSLTANTGGFGPGNIYGNNLYLYTPNGPSYPFAYASGSSVDDSAFLGFAGENINQSCPGDFNTAIGWRALNVNGPACGFQAIFNTAVGAQALTSNTVGLDNTATGYTALYQNITGNYNVAHGDSALYNNTAGNNNTASGHSSLLDTTGSFNTGSGSNALQYNASGSYNTALGALSGPDSASTALTNSTAIGAYAVVSQSNSLVLGSIANTNGCTSPCSSTSVGIGTATPQATLDVVGGANFSGTVNIATLNVTGSLSKPAGTFKIDHPLDPANKYLYHSFVESPDMMNVYNGNISTDGFGLATVTLPDWFEALNRDFRYQLTVIGQFAQAMVASEISHNQFTIRTDKPNVKISWQVTGIRQDAYANAHRVQVEEDKPAQDQGHYLHPELFGAGPEQAVGYRASAKTVAAQAPGATLHQ